MQLFCDLLSLDGIEGGSYQRVFHRRAFDKIIGSAALYCLKSCLFIFKACEHNDGCVGDDLADALDRLDAGAIRKAEVEQHDVELVGFEQVDGICQAGDRFDGEFGGLGAFGSEHAWLIEHRFRRHLPVGLLSRRS